MSKIDENEILRRLKLLSQIEPASDATNRAIEKVRDSLSDKDKSLESTSPWRFPKKSFAKFAAAAVLLIAAGYTFGRLTTQTPDMEQLQAALEKSLRASLTDEMDQRWQKAFTANCIKFKEQLQQQVRSDLTEFAAQTLAASNTLTEQRLLQLVDLIEAARERDRQQVATALKTIEFSRLQDKNQLGKGLVALAARTSELRDKKTD
jgi:parvulin-like peptidyl-prolyl isomerase